MHASYSVRVGPIFHGSSFVLIYHYNLFFYISQFLQASLRVGHAESKFVGDGCLMGKSGPS